MVAASPEEIYGSWQVNAQRGQSTQLEQEASIPDFLEHQQ
jgi:hypothetical protein